MSTTPTPPLSAPESDDAENAAMRRAEPIQYVPQRDPRREPMAAPIDTVTLLEDRAQVRRVARPALAAGRHKLFIEDVSPILQDVTLRGGVISERAALADVQVRRALRTRGADRSEQTRLLEEELATLERMSFTLLEERQALLERSQRVTRILTLSLEELPQDVAWGIDQSESWRESFERLCATRLEIADKLIELDAGHERVRERHDLARARLIALARPDHELAAWIELDLIVEKEGDEALEIEIDYIVPNALWRPAHRARLDGDVLTFTSRAAIWQRTGEAWRDVQLICSTAQSSLGTEAPLLSDDVVHAERRPERTEVSLREVAIAQASVDRGGSDTAPLSSLEAARPGGVALRGVDDGGDVQTIKAPHRVDVPSDGEPHFIELFEFKALSEVERWLAAELEERVVLRALQRNTGDRPLLAGPVELTLQGGVIGSTHTLFVTPGERFELGFGPDESLRTTRSAHPLAEEIDPQDRWTHRTYLVRLHLSNLSDEARQIVVKERVPISEVEQVKVFILKNKTSPGYELDEHGVVTWRVDLEGASKHLLTLQWRLSTAPDVTTI